MGEESSDLSGLLGGEGISRVFTTVDQGLDLGKVGGVRNEVGEFLAHAGLGQLEETVELLPELILEGHSGLLGEIHLAKIKGVKNALGGLVAFISLEVGKLAGPGEEEEAESGGASHTNKVGEGSSIRLGDHTGVDSLSESQLEGMLTVVLPHTLEVGLVGGLSGHFVRHDHLVLLDDLGGKLAKSHVLLAEGLGTLRGARVQTKHQFTVLVSVSERVKHAVFLLLGVVSIHVTLLFLPGQLGDLVVEETVAVATPEVLETQELERVGLLAVTSELDGSPLGLNVMESVLPGLARVGIDIPAVHLLALGPVGNAETLEDGTGLSVERHVSHTLEEGLGMEVLSVDVVKDVRLLVELVAIDVLDAQTYIIIKIKISTRLSRKHDSQLCRA